MTDSEQRRESEQKRYSDIVGQYETVRADAQTKLMGILLAGCTFFGGVIMYMAISAAKDVVKPINDQVLINKTEIGQIKADIGEIKDGQRETLRLLRHMDSK